MGSAFDFEDYRRRIEYCSLEGLRRDPTLRGMAIVAREAAAKSEAVLADRQDSEEARHIACRAGCGTCCVVNVAVLLPEAAAIVEYVKRRFGEGEKEALRRRLDDLHGATRWLDDEERLFLRRSCAFLDDNGSCSIHPARPLLCRSVTSVDAETCRNAVAMTALGESVPVLMNQFQKSLMDATYRGLADALEALGLDARGRRLTEAMREILGARSEAHPISPSAPNITHPM